MDELIYLLPIFACALMMGAMMWMMRRSNHTNAPQPETATQTEIATGDTQPPGQQPPTNTTGVTA